MASVAPSEAEQSAWGKSLCSLNHSRYFGMKVYYSSAHATPSHPSTTPIILETFESWGTLLFNR